jgi:predicted fused transcriptional regulator/phosphomethylpyrimidine kinase
MILEDTMAHAKDREEVLAQLDYAVSQLFEHMDPSLIPEVGTNIAYALPGARSPEDVAAVEGRIVRLGSRVHPVGTVKFGASDHIARIVLTTMKFDPAIRSAANIRFSEELIGLLEGLLFDICSFDRTKEPEGVRTMDWGVAFCCKEAVPDVIYDRGAMGKEPMIRILGEDPVTVAHNIIKLSGRIKTTTV